jgi:mannose-6-phosphate isomerase-like protein (cupin superfamily)
MEIRRLADVGRESPEKMTKTPVFDSDRMFFDVYVLLPGQSQRTHAHEASDKVYVVLEGTARVEIGGETARLDPGEAAIARAGVPHGIRNDGSAPLRCLVVMTPKP